MAVVSFVLCRGHNLKPGRTMNIGCFVFLQRGGLADKDRACKQKLAFAYKQMS